LEANTARRDAAEASKNEAAANLASSQAHEQLTEVKSACDEELAKGKRDVARMESWLAALQSDVDSAASRATSASERASVAEAAASQSRADEVRARADLQVKVEDIARLESSCHALRADLAKVRGALTSEAERASGAERMVEQLRTQLRVALNASDLHESEILRMIRADSKASKSAVTTVDKQSPSKAAQHDEPATVEDVAQALGLTGSSNIESAVSETLQQECQLPFDTAHHESADETPTVSNQSLESAGQKACPSAVLPGSRRMRTKKADPSRVIKSQQTKGKAKAKAKGKAKVKGKGKAKGKASRVPLRKLHIKTAKVADAEKRSVRKAAAAAAAAAATAGVAAIALGDTGNHKDRVAKEDVATPKRGKRKAQTKVTPQATKETKLRVTSRISKTRAACSAKLRTAALASESSPGHPAEDLDTCKVANLDAQMAEQTSESLQH